MVERYCLNPPGMFQRIIEGKHVYSLLVVARGTDHAHVYLTGRTSLLLNGEIAGMGDMRIQIEQVCKNIKVGLDFIGATFADVVRQTIYTTDVEEYLRCVDARFAYFADPPPADVLLQVSRLARPELLVEIECEAVMEPERLLM